MYSKSKHASSVLCDSFVPNEISFCQQLGALICRNVLLKWRNFSMILFPLGLMIAMMAMVSLWPEKKIVIDAEIRPHDGVKLYPDYSHIQENKLYLSNLNQLANSTWYLVDNQLLNNEQLVQFISLLQQSYNRSGLSLLSTIRLNNTFHLEHDFELAFNTSFDMRLAIFLDAYNTSTFKYSIRMAQYTVPDSTQLVDQTALCLDLRNSIQCPSFQYYLSGFQLVQSLMDIAIINFVSGHSKLNYTISNLQIGTFPQSKRVYSENIMMLCFIMVDSFATLILFASSLMVKEKEKRIKEALFMMGLDQVAYWTGWLLVELLLVTIMTLAWTIFLLYWHLVVVDPILLFFWIESYAASCILIACLVSTFFNKSKNVSVFAFFLSLVMSFVPHFLLNMIDLSNWNYKVLSIFSPIAFATCLKGLLDSYEYVGISNLFNDPAIMSVGFSLSILIFDCALYMILTLALDHIIRNRKFIFYYKFFNITKRVQSSQDQYKLDNNLTNFTANIEPVNEEVRMRKVIEINQIVKHYENNVMALRNVSFDLYESHITAILGPNGAGKTTLISIMTGEEVPTSGSITIYGLNVRQPLQLRKLRTRFGVCLQEDILFDELTPLEHLQFFAQMKGFTGKEMHAEVDNILQLVDLEQHRKTYSGKLSGGQKRKLCIGIALVGKSKIIFLDEPTSGVDVQSRKKLWSLLQSLKKDRTIILTTHFMDEADRFSDRKAFLLDGQLQCVGSSMFLKSKYCVGYHLRLEIDSNTYEQDILNLVLSKIPSAQLDRATELEMLFTLPKQTTLSFPSLFDALDQRIADQQLDIRSYGISMTTLDDVFLQICQGSAIDQTSVPPLHVESTTTTNTNTNVKDVTIRNSITFKVNSTQKMLHLVRIRFLLLLRNSGFCVQLILQLIILLLVAFFVSKMSKSSSNKGIILNTDLYQEQAVLYREKETSQTTIDSLRRFTKPTEVKAFTRKYMQNAIYAMNFSSTNNYNNMELLFNSSYTYSLPILQNLLSNLLLDVLANKSSLRIVTENRPLTKVTVNPAMLMVYLMLLNIALATFPAILSADVVEDREDKIKSYLQACGLRSIEYWCATWLVHCCILLLICLLLALFMVIFLPFDYDTFNKNVLLCSILLVLLYVPTAILLCYMFAFLFDKKETAQSGLPLITMTTAAAGWILYLLCKFTFNSPTIARILPFLFPFSVPTICLYSIYEVSTVSRDSQKIFYWKWQNNILPCFLSLTMYAIVSLFALPYADWAKANFEWKNIFKRSKKIVSATTTNPANVEFDVRMTTSRVYQIISSLTTVSKLQVPLLLIKDLTKVFGDVVAVNSLSLLVESGHIFGLLGTNGAGKTTTVRILVNEETKTSGNILIDGVEMNSNFDFSSALSYCPQANPLWRDITLLEYLKLFCAIRGVPSAKMNVFCQRLISIFGIEEHANKRCECLSGGTKRKLCLLISMIGDSKLTILDEPSTGMDPQSKRRMWNLILANFDENGKQSAILTTHSMEEVEVLCTQMAIMSKGSLQCLGSVQHLKNKYGSGYLLEIKLKPESNISKEDISKLLSSLFPKFTEFEINNDQVKIEIAQKDTPPLAQVFHQLHSWQTNHDAIEEYAFCQSSIERIFIGFADQQQSTNNNNC